MYSVPQVSDVLHRYASTLLAIENANAFCPLSNELNVRIVLHPQTCYSRANGAFRMTEFQKNTFVLFCEVSATLWSLSCE